jgi:hypothetical protein
MATAKKSTAKRRKTTGAPKRKRKTRVGEAAKTVKIAGHNFNKSSCHSNKTDAKKRADSVRSKGSRARVLKSGKTYCVYTGGKSKALGRKRA